MDKNTDNQQVATKKVQRKFINVQKAEVVKKHLNSKYKKWQLKIAKWIGVEVSDTYQYLFRIAYKGSARLKVNDVVATLDGEVFAVMREENRIAMIASSIGYTKKPTVRGKLYIIEKPKNKNK